MTVQGRHAGKIVGDALYLHVTAVAFADEQTRSSIDRAAVDVPLKISSTHC